MSIHVLRAVAPLPLATAPDSMGPATAAPPMLRLGSTGPAVQALQTRLAALRYLPAVAVDEHFGLRTWHAVVAFQGWSGVARDGVVGPQTRGALDGARVPEAWSTRPGFEIHVPQQVLLMIRAGRVTRAIHVSTGAGGSTPTGHFRVVRREHMSWSSAFGVWMPYAQYFADGYALHGFPSVPTYPTSHGCVRVPEPEALAVWRFGRRGTRVWVGS